MTLPAGFDPRVTPWRPDLAAAALEGLAPAKRHVAATPCHVSAPLAGILEEPRHEARLANQALMGETVEVYEMREGWAWGQLVRDGYVGYVPLADLAEGRLEPTHQVAVPASLIFPRADLKSAPARPVYLNSLLAIDGEEGDYARLAGGGYIFAAHLRRLDQPASDAVTVAERFIATPYLWGGSSHAGLDCSGLVQMALLACGRACPRDSDMMAEMAAEDLPIDEPHALRRGDMVLWRGHVGLMRDHTHLIHANAHHMAVAVEPLSQAMARIAAAGSPVTAFRRLFPQ